MTHAERLRDAAQHAQDSNLAVVCVSPSRLLIVLDQLQQLEQDVWPTAPSSGRDERHVADPGKRW